MASRGLVEDVVSLDSPPLVLKPGGRTCLVTRVHSIFDFQVGHSNLVEGDLCCKVVLVTWFLVVFGDEVTKILGNSLFIFRFVLPVLACKQKTLYRKSGN